MLVEKYAQEVSQILAKYPPEERRAAVMPLLYLVQRDQMFIDRKSMDEVASILGISTTDVASVVGFYTLFHDKKGGKFYIQVCTDLPCALRGADKFMEQLCERLGIEPGQTTPDGLFTVEPVMCLAACDRAPMFQLQSAEGLEYHENQTVENALSLIEGLRAQIAHKGGLKRRQDHE
ncbi:MAG: NADH-quinone oxidoreductase subunit NuoE [Anaerolineales bacterium]|jgi:NADH-quinone oxidoreductase subunit E